MSTSAEPPAVTNPPDGPPPGPAQAPVVVKKYANRRLYNTETSSYITLENLADMIRAGRDFVVYDAKSSEDITRGVLTQIIVEEESKGTSMLPTPFLRQLIGFYGDSLQGVVPRYLETAMSSFARQQQQLRQVVTQTFSPFIPPSVEEMSRQNLAMIEKAMGMFNPFHRGTEPAAPAPSQPAQSAPCQALAQEESAEAAPTTHQLAFDAQTAELETMRLEVESLRHQLALAHANANVAQAPIPQQLLASPSLLAPNVVADPVSIAAPDALKRMAMPAIRGLPGDGSRGKRRAPV